MAKEIPARMRRLDAKSVQARILTIYDDMTEFQDQCSFLCDAFASIVRQQEVIDQETIRGVSIYSEQIKEQVGRIRSELKLSSEEITMLASASATNVVGQH